MYNTVLEDKEDNDTVALYDTVLKSSLICESAPEKLTPEALLHPLL